MEDDNDFTFCQVTAPVEAQNYVPDIGGIMIKEPTNEITDKLNNDNARRDDVPSNGVSKKEATFGSLSFTVVDASVSKYTSGKALVENGGNQAKVLQEPKASVRKPAPRTKVAFEIGHSPMDWLKLTRTHPDLAGLKGQSNRRLIPMREVKEHRTEGSMWTVLKGRVYNLSPYLKFHPGGEDMLMKAVGKDCTSLFNKYHAWVNAEFLLEKCLVGTLDDSK